MGLLETSWSMGRKVSNVTRVSGPSTWKLIVSLTLTKAPLAAASSHTLNINKMNLQMYVERHSWRSDTLSWWAAQTRESFLFSTFGPRRIRLPRQSTVLASSPHPLWGWFQELVTPPRLGWPETVNKCSWGFCRRNLWLLTTTHQIQQTTFELSG